MAAGPRNSGSFADDGAGRVAEHAVDAHAELLEGLELGRALAVRALLDRLASLAVMIQGFTFLNLSMKPSISTTRSRTIGKFARGSTSTVSPYSESAVLQVSFGSPFDHHPAASAHGHAARPAVRERRVDLVLDEVERVEDLPVGLDRESRSSWVFGTSSWSGSKRVMTKVFFSALTHQYLRSSGSQRAERHVLACRGADPPDRSDTSVW